MSKRLTDEEKWFITKNADRLEYEELQRAFFRRFKRRISLSSIGRYRDWRWTKKGAEYKLEEGIIIA